MKEVWKIMFGVADGIVGVGVGIAGRILRTVQLF